MDLTLNRWARERVNRKVENIPGLGKSEVISQNDFPHILSIFHSVK
jgi:hypothetical protein